MKSGTKRAKDRAKAKAAKAARMARPGESSRYAKKRKGQVQREHTGHGQKAVCGTCYRQCCICKASAQSFPSRWRRRR